MREISREQVEARLRGDNPWWLDPRSVFARKWTPRPYLDAFFPHVVNRRVRRALVLMGPRRVGKTVLLHHAIQRLLDDQEVESRRLCYFRVDHPLYNGLGLEELLDVYSAATSIDYRTEPCFVFFDEIQYLRDWELHLKALVDRFEAPKFIVSGSAAAALRLKSADSGAGRMTEFLLPPLTFFEYLALSRKSSLVVGPTDGLVECAERSDIETLNREFVDYLNYGGYPEVVLTPEIRADPGRYIKSDIIDKVLLRDLPSLYGIQDIQELNSLFTTLAYNTAGELSLEGLSKRSGVAKNTIKRYIEYLEAAFMVKVVHRLGEDGRRFRRATQFKVHLTNPAIRCALFSPIRDGDESMGALVETAIFAQWFHHDAETPFYARWRGGEVDLVYVHQGEVRFAVEAKWSDSAWSNSHACDNLVRFHAKAALPMGALMTTKTKVGQKTFDDLTVSFVPTSLYCYVLGQDILDSKSRQVGQP